MYIYIYIHTYTYIQIHIHIHININIHIHIHIPDCTRQRDNRTGTSWPLTARETAPCGRRGHQKRPSPLRECLGVTSRLPCVMLAFALGGQ